MLAVTKLHACDSLEEAGNILSWRPPKMAVGERGDMKTPKFPCLSTKLGWSASSSIPSKISTSPECLDCGHGVVDLNSFLISSGTSTLATLVIFSTT